MAITRKGVIQNMDAEVYIDIISSQARAVQTVIAAKRYDNLTAFAAELSSVAWEPNQWGDQTKRLIDNAKGYRIRESYFTTDKITEAPFTATSLSPAAINPSQNTSVRTSVMYSYDQGGYLYVDPASSALPPDQKSYAIVGNHQYATRFTNLLDFETLLDGSILGDYPQGWGIQQYYFTKPIDVPRDGYNWFSGAPAADRDIQRAFVPWSKEKGLYLWIDDIALPPAQMTFDFVPTPWQGVRITNLGTFDTITSQTILADEIYGWEVPQFYFNRSARPKPKNPFNDFWELTPIPTMGLGAGEVIPWIEGIIGKYLPVDDYRSFQNRVSENILTPWYYNEYEEDFNNFWGQQDFSAYEQWLQDTFWIPAGGTPPRG